MKKSTESLKHRHGSSLGSSTWFYWRGLTPLGENKSGFVKTLNESAARSRLSAEGIILKSLSPRRGALHLKRSEWIRLVRQLATLLTSGMSLHQALELMIQTQHHVNTKGIIHHLKDQIESGHSFAEALTQHPHCFSNLHCKLVHIGENAGRLALIIDKIASHEEKHEGIKKDMKALLMYPLLVLILTITMTIIMLVTIVPQFQVLFQQFKSELPWATVCVLRLSQWTQSYGLIVIIMLSSMVMGFRWIHKTQVHTQLLMDKLFLKLPLVGRLLSMIILKRSLSVWRITHMAGLCILDCLEASADASGNACFANAFMNLAHTLAQGESLNHALSQNPLFPNLTRHMLNLGDAAGTLVEMLTYLETHYHSELDLMVKRWGGVIEPLLMALLGLMIGGLVMALYLPMLQLGSLV